MEELKRIAAIHDISGLGKCSLTVALPVISASGVECSCLPTALLSTHTGEFEGFTFFDLSGQMLRIAEHWKSTGAAFDGIYSGYLANAAQAETVLRIIGILSSEGTRVIVDPVMADNGRFYSKFDDEMCAAFRRLCARADAITPNITEAALLAGVPYMEGPHREEYISRLFEGLSAFCKGIIAITGVWPDENRVGAVAFDTAAGETCAAYRKHEPGIFYGTGDIFASAFSALTVRGVPLEPALGTAISLVDASICRTVRRAAPRRFGVDFEGALPGYIQAVSALFKE